MEKAKSLYLSLNSLVIFRNFLTDRAGAAFLKMLQSLTSKASAAEQTSACAAFAAFLYPVTTNWSLYVRDFVCGDDNFYIRQCASDCITKQSHQEQQPDSCSNNTVLESCLQRELDILTETAAFSPDDFAAAITTSASGGESLPDSFIRNHLPRWEVSNINLQSDFKNLLHNLPTKGFGIYASHNAFSVCDGSLMPVRHPDSQRLSDLTGYEHERRLVENNTLALLKGETFCNVLLYGDAGTGKSSTVKALANEYADQGLRLIEIRKKDLFELPRILETLSEIPLKFIIFIDDLSLSDDDGDFSALKAIIEGSVMACNKNTAIYATSNRRHLVKENMTDRTGDDLHINDTVQEMMSLSARFGLTVTFLRPEKELYLDIVNQLAAYYGLELPRKELETRAEAFALRAGGRSPRAAKQFVLFEKSQGCS